MPQLSTKIEIYCKANGVSEVNFLEDVKLQNDGEGPYIKEWNLDIAKPTNEQLAAVENDANIEESNNNIRATRKAAYGDIGDQLDEIYKDIDAWKTRIKKIKDDNPKG
jgi:hypothetical protein